MAETTENTTVEATNPTEATVENTNYTVITVAGTETKIDLKSLTAEQLATMSDEQLVEAKKEFEKFKQEFNDVKNVFTAYYKARAKSELAKIKSLLTGYLLPIAKWAIGLAVAAKVFNII